MILAASALASVLNTNVFSSPPNVVLFIVDDLGWQDSSVPFTTTPTSFNKTYRTPNLQSLASKSSRYTQAYSAATVCTPSRTSIMSGKNPARTHITYWTFNGDTSASDPATIPPKWQHQGLLPKDGPFLPQLLTEAGYKTIHIGKAHFGSLNQFAANPNALGFQTNIAGSAIGHPGSFLGTHKFMNSLRNGQPEKPSSHDVQDLKEYHGQDIYLTEALAIEARKQIQKAKIDQPFFLYFAPYAVHTPIMANPKYLDNYKSLDPREAAYATMIESYDHALGQIIEELKTQNRFDNTLIIFTSDNGGLSVHSRAGNDDRNAPLRGGKGTFYEGGTRVPLIIHEPNQAKSQIFDQTVIGTDLYDYVLKMAGINHINGPDSEPQRLKQSLDRPLVWHIPHFWGANGQGIEPHSAIRFQNYKLIYKHRDLTFELYNLETDLGETSNLAKSNPLTTQKLAQKLGQELRSLGAEMPTSKATMRVIPFPDQLNLQ